MFGKLIKYEFRATGRVMLPLLAAVVVLSPLFGLCVNITDPASFGSFLISVVNAAFTIAVIGVFIASFILMIRRFRSSFLSDEGYLTFTLPVRTSSLIFSKLIVSFAWFAAALVSCLIAGEIIGAVTGSANVLPSFRSSLGEIAALVGRGNIMLYCVEAFVCAFLFSCFVCLHFYAAMALGHSFSNHKTFLSICFYILLSVAMTLLFALFADTVADSRLLASYLDRIGRQFVGISDVRVFASVPHALFAPAAVFLLAGSALYYIPTVLPLKKHLNLN